MTIRAAGLPPHDQTLLGYLAPRHARTLAASPWGEQSADNERIPSLAPTGELGVKWARGNVRHWKIWNEPTHYAYWGGVPDPDAYGRLVRDTAACIRSVQPDAIIAAGSLAGLDAVFVEQFRQAFVDHCFLRAEVSMYFTPLSFAWPPPDGRPSPAIRSTTSLLS